jgi:chitin disaccharide deacetylase
MRISGAIMNIAKALDYERYNTQKLLIVNADDFGLCHATNQGVQQLLEAGVISSATVMMPCAWAKEAAHWSTTHPQYDVGVHLTFTSEWDVYKWGPVTRNADTTSLITEEGYFPDDCQTFERRANPEQVRTEIIHQIELARKLGIDPTHLDNHMGCLYGLAMGRHFVEIISLILDICVKYGLPFRFPRSLYGRKKSILMEAGVKILAKLADAKGVVILDHLLDVPYSPDTAETYEDVKEETYEDVKHEMIKLLRGLRPGVTEIIIHPSLVTDELKAIAVRKNIPHWPRRDTDFKLWLDPDIHQVLIEEEIRMIRWFDLRNLQRNMK